MKKITFVIVIPVTDSASLLDEVTVMTYSENICKMSKTCKGYGIKQASVSRTLALEKKYSGWRPASVCFSGLGEKVEPKLTGSQEAAPRIPGHIELGSVRTRDGEAGLSRDS